MKSMFKSRSGQFLTCSLGSAGGFGTQTPMGLFPSGATRTDRALLNDSKTDSWEAKGHRGSEKAGRPQGPWE